MIYKWYFKGKSDFSKHNTLGEPIRQDVKNRDVNSGEKTMTINTRKIAKKKETMTINNSILYNILVNRASANGNPLRIVFKNWCLGGVFVLEDLTEKDGKVM